MSTMRWSAVVLSAVICALTVPISAVAADPDARPGTYSGQAQGHYKLSFTINSKTTSILKFRTAVVTYCVTGIGPSGPTVKSVTLPTIKLGRTGRFDKTFTTTKAGTKVVTRVRGDIDRGRLSAGKLTYELTGDGIECKTDGAQPLSAKRK